MRRAGKAGTWYPKEEVVVSGMIDGWFESINTGNLQPKVVIVPHAGYRYSGFTAAHSYKLLRSTHRYNVFVLHPSHHVNLKRLMQCPFESVETPLGPITTKKIPGITDNSQSTDSTEHSAELQFPFLKFIECTAVSAVMIGGAWSDQDFKSVVEFLNDNPDTVIVVSSDFCHYGPNYGYELDDATSNSIKQLDLLGYNCISEKKTKKFREYLMETGNTICGQNAICLTMDIINAIYPHGHWTLLNYSQSSDLKVSDNSVSYLAAAYTTDPIKD